MADSESNVEKMDKAAEEARLELVAKIAGWDAVAVRDWCKKWYGKAGYKRLARVLAELAGAPVKRYSGSQTTAHQDVFKLEQTSETLEKVSEKKLPFNQISQATRFIRKAENTVLKDIVAGRVKDEEGLTDRLIGAIHLQFDHQTISGIHWSAMTLTAHKRNAQETWYGADLLGVLQVDIDDYSVRKGFLAQAKYLRDSKPLTPPEFRRLKGQCEKMLRHSMASYVFIYEPTKFSVIPAISIVSLNEPRKLPDLKRRQFVQFFEEHFDCFVGDPALHTSSDTTLEVLRKQVEARSAIQLSGNSG